MATAMAATYKGVSSPSIVTNWTDTTNAISDVTTMQEAFRAPPILLGRATGPDQQRQAPDRHQIEHQQTQHTRQTDLGAELKPQRVRFLSERPAELGGNQAEVIGPRSQEGVFLMTSTQSIHSSTRLWAETSRSRSSAKDESNRARTSGPARERTMSAAPTRGRRYLGRFGAMKIAATPATIIPQHAAS